MKKIFLPILFCSCFVFAQEKTYIRDVHVKFNAVSLLLAMPNIAMEGGIGKHFTLQPELFISPWKSFAGRHLQIYIGELEGRYYFKEAFLGWYFGLNFGLGFFDLQKPQSLYWNSGMYQRGYTWLMGGTVGYQFHLKNRWNMDIFIGGGSSQGNYHGYTPDGQRYETHGGIFNRSGEWLPYKGGVMLSHDL